MLLLLKKTANYLASSMASLVSLVEKGFNLKYKFLSAVMLVLVKPKRAID
jgi:hypothetical protein